MPSDLGAVLVVLVVAFAICTWSGRTLARHYQDPMEVAAIVAVGVCVLGSLIVTRDARAAGEGWAELVLALTMSGGLVSGYFRAERKKERIER